jgi:hypothetical protein
MRDLHLLRTRKQVVINPSGEDRRFHGDHAGLGKGLDPAVQLASIRSDLAFLIDLLQLRLLNMSGATKAITTAAPTSRGSHGPPRVSQEASTTQTNAADSTYHLLRSLNRDLSPAGGGSGGALLKTR